MPQPIDMRELTGPRLILRDFIREAWVLLERGEPIPYIWGGQNIETGVDCSGFVILGLIKAGILAEGFDTTANGLYKMCKGGGFSFTDNPECGDLVFYWNSKRTKISHVQFYYNDGLCMGAEGGGKVLKTREGAYNRGAWVRPVSRKARPRFAGYGKVL